MLVEKYEVKKCVRRAMRETPAIDMLTHLLPAGDDAFAPINASPLCEDTRGALYAFKRFGADIGKRDFTRHILPPNERLPFALRDAHISGYVASIDAFSEGVRSGVGYTSSTNDDFAVALSLNALVHDFPRVKQSVDAPENDLPAALIALRDSLSRSIAALNAQYALVDMPGGGFDPLPHRVLNECVLPVLKAMSCPILIVIGERGVMGFNRHQAFADIETLVRDHREHRFFISHALEEGQDALTHLARTFDHVLICGCSGEISAPGAMKRVLTHRIERLGVSHIPIFSGAHSASELIPRWDAARRILSEILTEKYEALIKLGYTIDDEDIRSDIAQLLRGNYTKYARKG